MKTMKKAFTLVELIIVIAVIGVLAAILIPTFANVIEKANAKSALSDARNISSMFLEEFSEEEANLPDLVIFSVKNKKIYVFGYDIDGGKVIADQNNPYKYDENTALVDQTTDIIDQLVSRGALTVNNNFQHSRFNRETLDRFITEYSFDPAVLCIHAGHLVQPLVLAGQQTQGGAPSEPGAPITVSVKNTIPHPELRYFVKGDTFDLEADTDGVNVRWQVISGSASLSTTTGKTVRVTCEAQGDLVIRATSGTYFADIDARVYDPSIGTAKTIPNEITLDPDATELVMILVSRDSEGVVSFSSKNESILTVSPEATNGSNGRMFCNITAVGTGSTQLGIKYTYSADELASIGGGNSGSREQYVNVKINAPAGVIDFTTGQSFKTSLIGVAGSASSIKQVIFEEGTAAAVNTSLSLGIANPGSPDATCTVKDGSSNEIATAYWYSSEGIFLILSDSAITAPANCNYMFAGTGGTLANLETVDFTNLNAANVTSAKSIFYGCVSLERIYVADASVKWNVGGNASNAFTDCTSLLNSNGESYDANSDDMFDSHHFLVGIAPTGQCGAFSVR